MANSGGETGRVLWRRNSHRARTGFEHVDSVKEFGVSRNFRTNVIGQDDIRLQVKPGFRSNVAHGFRCSGSQCQLRNLAGRRPRTLEEQSDAT